jgi:hypothetical protein
VSGGKALGLFEGVGIETESMIVDAGTLDVRPLADEVLRAEGGAFDDVERGSIAWSNELVLHVLEMKTNGPAATFAGLAAHFEENVARLHALLAPHGARLLGGGMHPWMDPARERRLWPHGYGEVYAAFDRIFDCRGHGWANLQSVHLNLPFAGDAEFGRLHAAARVLLPVIPALAAASPVAEGRVTGSCDTRLDHYRENSRRVPSVSGLVIPERVYTRRDYEERILGAIYADLAPLDPGGILRDEWANARGAIARFDRSALEIRLVDSQECPRADLAVAAAVTGAARGLVEERLSPFREHSLPPEAALAPILAACVRGGSRTRIGDAAFLGLLGWKGAVPCAAGDLWAHLVETTFDLAPGATELRPVLASVLRGGTLAERLLDALGPEPRRGDLDRVYRRLADCMRDGTVFQA